MAASQIGSFDFVSMLPPPYFPRPALEYEARAGVSGYAAWKTGITADQFQVTTLRDLASFNAAESQFLAYQTICGTVQTIRYAGDLMPFMVLVQCCEPEEIRRIALGVGGILGVSRAIVRAKWTLIPWVQP